ncbi:hypothetical protein KL947_005040 [Ogataea haglerorum]|nr:hypothetical protein KL947_005040 [Ogataea haglerorum]
MAIAPRYAKSHVYNGPAGLSGGLRHTVQLYLDYNCPFSGKLFRKITGDVIPLLEKKNLLDKFSFVFMNVIQPWHYVGSGAYHEVALAVAKVYPEQFWQFSGVLWDNVMTDSLSYEKTKKQVLATAIDLAAQHLDHVEPAKLWEQVAVPEGGQNQLQKDIKYFTRYHRTVGVHVTPTVFVDGMVVGSIESSTQPEKISFELKTPPHSVVRHGPVKSHDTRSALRTNGLLSPEFSSPQVTRGADDDDDDDDEYDEPGFSRKRKLHSSPPPPPKFAQPEGAAKSRAPNKTRRLKGPQNIEIPDPEDMPPVTFDSHEKPPFSYASLIGMAILRAPGRKLTLSQIYQWISDNFKYYKKGEVGWQNSIRHNLSLNKSFAKTEKSKDGKGHFWKIVDGYEYQFCNIKNFEKMMAAGKLKRSRDSHPQPAAKSLSYTPQTSHRHPQSPELPLKRANTDPYHVDFDRQHPAGPLGSIPELVAPSSSWKAAAAGEHIVFKETQMSPEQSFLQESPGGPIFAARSLPFTSSFSCKSTLELSPIKSGETGPLLEPLTPKQNSSLNTLQKSQYQYDQLLLSKFRSPTSVLKTPNLSASKKLWTSPSYLDDFYTSPSTGRGADEDAVYGSPLAPVKKRKTGSSSRYSANEIFGIDICKIHHDD